MIEPRLWLDAAKGIPIGHRIKMKHKGCSNSEALMVNNSPDAWWCYCTKCRQSGHVDKKNPGIKVKLPKNTGRIPDDLIRLVDGVIKEPLKFKQFLDKNPVISHNMRLCKYSEWTERVYMQDESDSYYGIDVTGKAYARWYSPKRQEYAHFWRTFDKLMITDSPETYLSILAGGAFAAMLIAGPGGMERAKVVLAEHPDWYTQVKIVGAFKRRNLLDLQQIIGLK